MKKPNADYIVNMLHLADIHFGKKNDTKLYNDLQEYFITEIPKIINDYGHLNMLVIAGDLFDRVIKMTENSANYALKFITDVCELSNKYNFYIRIIQGTKSHDNNQLNNFNHFEVKYPLFKIIRTVSTETITINTDKYELDFNILYLPEEYPENYKKYYSKYIGDNKKYDFIFGHGMMDFVAFTGDEDTKHKIKHNESIHSTKTIDNMCQYFTVFGHIHDRQNYKDKDKILYTGSFERFTFADQEPKGFLLTCLNTETEKTEVIFYENKNASTYKILDLSDFSFNNTEEKIKFIESEKQKYTYLKVLVDKDDDNTELLKSVVASDVKIETHNRLPDDVVDERFNFLIRKELPIDKSIAKYIDLTTGNKVSTEIINEMILKADSI